MISLDELHLYSRSLSLDDQQLYISFSPCLLIPIERRVSLEELGYESRGTRSRILLANACEHDRPRDATQKAEAIGVQSTSY